MVVPSGPSYWWGYAQSGAPVQRSMGDVSPSPPHPACLGAQVGGEGMAFSLGLLGQHWVSLRLAA